jgi:putative membrane protein
MHHLILGIAGFVINIFAIRLLAPFIPEVKVKSWATALNIAIVVAILHYVVRLFIAPVLHVAFLPFHILSLGLTVLLVNWLLSAVILKIATYVDTGFQIKGFRPALILSLLLSVVHFVVMRILFK